MRAPMRVDYSVDCLQGGASFHWAPEARSEMDASRLDFASNQPARSPDLNPIENLVGMIEGHILPKIQQEKRCKTAGDWAARVQQACKTVAARGCVANMAKSRPARIKEVLDAKGGPAKY